MGGGRQRWGACVVGAGWGVGHSTLFSKSRLLSRTGGVMKSEWPLRKRAPLGVFSVFFGSNFVRKLPAVAGFKLCVGIFWFVQARPRPYFFGAGIVGA